MVAQGVDVRNPLSPAVPREAEGHCRLHVPEREVEEMALEGGRDLARLRDGLPIPEEYAVRLHELEPGGDAPTGTEIGAESGIFEIRHDRPRIVQELRGRPSPPPSPEERSEDLCGISSCR